jgi:hypothetical protein
MGSGCGLSLLFAVLDLGEERVASSESFGDDPEGKPFFPEQGSQRKEE